MGFGWRWNEMGLGVEVEWGWGGGQSAVGVASSVGLTSKHSREHQRVREIG